MEVGSFGLMRVFSGVKLDFLDLEGGGDGVRASLELFTGFRRKKKVI